MSIAGMGRKAILYQTVTVRPQQVCLCLQLANEQFCFLTLKWITNESRLLLHLEAEVYSMMLPGTSNPQCLEVPGTNTEVCVFEGRLPFETCIL